MSLFDGCYFFYAKSVGPCKRMMPTIEHLQGDGFRIEKIDMSIRSDLAKRYAICVIPTVLIKNGSDVVKLTGLQGEQALRASLVRYNVEKQEISVEPPFVLVYPVADLTPAGKTDLKALATRIETDIAPSTWENAGGQGRINPGEKTLSLVIRQTPRVHFRIQRLLKDLRRPAKAPIEEVETR